MPPNTQTFEPLEEADINNVPRNQLYRLDAPVTVNNEVVAHAGEFFFIPSLATLPPQHRVLIETVARSSPEQAYILLELVRKLHVAIPLRDEGIHSGVGIAAASEGSRVTSGPKADIKPAPINAQPVAPTLLTAGEFGEQKAFGLLARTYRCVGASTGRTTVTDHGSDHIPTFGGGMAGMLAAGLFMPRGMAVQVQPDTLGNTLLRKWGGLRDTVKVDPQTQLAVCMME